VHRTAPSAARPPKKRIKAKGEPGKRGPYQCKRYFQFGHIEKGCTNPQVQPDEGLLEQPPNKKNKSQQANKKKKSEPATNSEKNAQSKEGQV
jgi:hypothetical protein